MTEVRTDHQIVPFGPNLMKLFDSKGAVVVQAEREHDKAQWEIHTDADEVADDMADTRSEAIDKMIHEMTPAVLGPNTSPSPGNGYSCLVPHGLPETP